MINLDDCIELGVIAKPHGIKGQVIAKLNDFSFDEIINMELVFVLIDGLPVPFFIDEFSERSDNTLLVKFSDIDSEPKAKHLTGSLLFLPKKYLTPGFSPTVTNLDLYKNYKVIDKLEGFIGTFDTLLEINQNPVLRIVEFTHEILLPLQPDFIKGIDEEKKEIHVHCPPGLIDIYRQ